MDTSSASFDSYEAQIYSLTRDTGFPAQLRYWRRLRGFSQLDLALAADVSSRHLSFLETGRSKASDQTIGRLASALDLSCADERSLRRANFGFGEQREPPDARTKATLERMVERHAPYPALIVDSLGTIHHANRAMTRLLTLVPIRSSNLFKIYFARDGFRTVLEDSHHIGSLLFAQIRRELLALNRPEAMVLLIDLTDLAPDLAAHPTQSEKRNVNPVMETVLRVGAMRLHLSHVFASFGSEDADNNSDWRVETVFPMDDETAAFFTTEPGVGTVRDPPLTESTGKETSG